jgi:LPS sulfotransferase NodH
LLCGLLESTGVAGHPESYFRQPDEQSWAARWGISSPDGSFSYADFVSGALATGRTDNGAFAARIMWGTLAELAANLAGVHPDLAGTDARLLERAFGPVRYLYLRRRDVVAQAVSWLRAEQTNVWYETVAGAGESPEREPDFDFGQIHDLVKLIGEHNAAWQEWFRSAGVQPYPVRYEDLDEDPVGVTSGVLDFLGLELPPGRQIQVQHKRLSDGLNTRWISRYRAEAPGPRASPPG